MIFIREVSGQPFRMTMTGILSNWSWTFGRQDLNGPSIGLLLGEPLESGVRLVLGVTHAPPYVLPVRVSPSCRQPMLPLQRSSIPLCLGK